MIPAYRWGWTYISHFIHSRFYCYSYSFGELLTLALFQRYLDEGEAFVPGYMRLLESGGSQRPEHALARIGININQLTRHFHSADTPNQKIFQALKIVDEYKKVGQKLDRVMDVTSEITKKWLQR